MDNREKFKILNFAELYGCNRDGFLEVVSKCKIQTNVIYYQSLLCARPLSEETKQKIEALAEKASELIKEHQFNFNNLKATLQ